MILSLLLASASFTAMPIDTTCFEVWHLDNLSLVGGRSVTVVGAPTVQDIDGGKAIVFDGVDDGLIVHGCPIDECASFTVEVLFKPFAAFPNNREQRFLHIQKPQRGNRRVLIETRLTEANEWFVDTHIHADSAFMTCLAKEFTHPVDQWYHVALVYESGIGRHFVNGVQEMSGRVDYIPLEGADVSLGMRMNQIWFFKGAIRSVALTRRALRPEEFMLGSGSSQSLRQNAATQLKRPGEAEFRADEWVAEFEDPSRSKLLVTKEMIEIDASAGATVWHKNRLSGDLLITYDVTVVDSAGRNDRVSDLNAFWMASDPAHETPFGRNGKFTSYDDLDLYYAGVGGHDNTTTRFRRYRHGTDKSILQEYTDKDHLLRGNTTYSIAITVRDGKTFFSINERQYFQYADTVPLKEGYFAFRTTRSRQRITNFKIEQRPP